MDNNRQNSYERKIGCCKHVEYKSGDSNEGVKKKSWQQNDCCKCDWNHISGV